MIQRTPITVLLTTSTIRMCAQDGAFAEHQHSAHYIRPTIAAGVDVVRVIDHTVIVTIPLRVRQTVARVHAVGSRQRHEALSVDDRAGGRAQGRWRGGNWTCK
jgi:hypothetical protein